VTPFIVAGAALALAALALVVPPLVSKRRRTRAGRAGMNLTVYRDQARELDADLANGLLTSEQHAIAREELEARMLEDVRRAEADAARAQPAKVTAFIIAAAVPLGALAIYLLVGTPAALDPRTLEGRPAQQIDEKQIVEMVERLAQKLKENPENGVGWAMLARSYRYFGKHDEAARAYAEAVARLEPDAGLYADYADAVASAQGTLTGEPEKLIAKALEIDPKNLKALALAGTVRFNAKDYAGAVRYWEQMLTLVPRGSETAKAIEANIAEARGLAGASR